MRRIANVIGKGPLIDKMRGGGLVILRREVWMPVRC